MGTEEQIINDIIDSVYGFDIVTEENDSKKQKIKEEERQKKYDDTLLQINSLCKNIEKELGKTINTSTPEISTHIRLTVLTTIREEISNGNKVLDANGKINVGKFLDIVIQSKDEILGKIEADTDRTNDNPLESSDSESKSEPELTPYEEEEIEDFLNGLEEFGIELSTGEEEAVRRAKKAVKEFERKVQEKIDLGMAEDEAIKAVYDSMTVIERMELDLQIGLVNMQDRFTAHKMKEVNDDEKGDTSSKTEITLEDPKPQKNTALPKVTVSTTLEPDEFKRTGSKPQKETTYSIYGQKFHNIYMESYNGGEIQNTFTNLGGQVSDISNLLDTQNAAFKLATNEKFISQINFNPEYARQIAMQSRTMEQIMTPPESKPAERRTSSEGRYKTIEDTLTQYTGMEYQQILNGVNIGTSTIRDEEKEDFAEIIAKQSKYFTPTLHEMSHSTIERKIINRDDTDELLMSSKISDKDIGPYFDRHSKLLTFSREDLYAEHFMPRELEGGNGLAEMRGDDTEIVDEPASVTPASAPISTTPPRSVPTSIVEEMTVDESGVTQEGKSEPNKNGILSVRDIMALVENQAEVRKMLEANGIIHGQMPEGPTTGKPETQGAPVADNDEKSGEGPEEH